MASTPSTQPWNEHLRPIIRESSRSLETGQGPSVPVPDGDVPPSTSEFIGWFDIYPPAEVETIGRETLLSAPAPYVEELDDGSVLLVSKHPADADPGPLDEVADHVGIRSWEDYPDERASRSDFEE